MRKLAAAFLVLITFGTTAVADTIAFSDITGTTGVGLTSVLTESVAWGDYDDDGDPDLYLTVRGTNRLFRNDLQTGTGGQQVFVDVTDEAGVGDALWGVGTAFGDLDNDGDLDLYVTNFGTGPDVLYRNNGPVGPGGVTTFTDVAFDAGIRLDRSSRGMAFIDFNADGLLDIYVNAIGDDILYRNNGNLTFADVAGDVGVDDVDGQGVGVVATDVNRDGHVDLFTGNRSNDLNRLFLNDGDGTFTDITGDAGIDQVGLGMGVISLDYDYDNDLDFDLYWTTWPGGGQPEENALYRNNGGAVPIFTDVATGTMTTDAPGWGISANASDIDNDGWMDFFVTNGFDPGSGPNILFRNDQGSDFDDVTSSLENGAAFDGRGVAFADFDLDGDVDLILTGDETDTNRLWRNDSENDNHWLTLELVGTDANASAIGAVIEVATNLGTTLHEASGGAGRGSFNDLPVEIGLGAATTVQQITIYWPGGGFQTLENIAVDQRLTIVEIPEPGTIVMLGVGVLTWLTGRCRHSTRHRPANRAA